MSNFLYMILDCSILLPYLHTFYTNVFNYNSYTYICYNLLFFRMCQKWNQWPPACESVMLLTELFPPQNTNIIILICFSDRYRRFNICICSSLPIPFPVIKKFLSPAVTKQPVRRVPSRVGASLIVSFLGFFFYREVILVLFLCWRFVVVYFFRCSTMTEEEKKGRVDSSDRAFIALYTLDRYVSSQY